MAGNATLNWSADLAVERWDGVTVEGPPLGVTGLDLRARHLTGTIPVEIGNLTNLSSLDLSDNRLTGEIPMELGSLTNLSSLSLSYNRLTGEIPMELGSLTNLSSLSLSGPTA